MALLVPGFKSFGGSIQILTAVTGLVTPSIENLGGMLALLIQGNFTYGSGGTTAKFWLQTSCDQGVTWNDIANFAFTTASARRQYNLSALTPKTSIITPTDATLADNTSVDGILGDRLRLKYTTTGTYAGTTTFFFTCDVKG